MFDVDSFEERVTRSNNKKHGGSSENSITHIKKRVEELDITQKIMLKLFRYRTKDSRTTVKNEIENIVGKVCIIIDIDIL